MRFLPKFSIVILWLGMAMPFYVTAQDKGGDTPALPADTTFSIDKLDSIFSYSDSLSIFNMIDSLLNSQPDVGSSMVLRAGFNSNIISAGRSIGVSQYGATIGGSYYHKSGLFVDASMYWSEAYNPSLYLTTLSVGYLKTFSKVYTAMISYDRLIYNNTDINVENPLTNMLGASNFVDIKPVTLRLDYSFYFGQQTAHRITPGVSLSLRKYKFLGLDRISFTPTYQLLFGNATITSIQLAQRNSVLLGRKLPIVQQTDSNEFGLMNHALALPLRISKKNWSFTFSYSYNWPVALPKEESTLPQNSFISLTLSKMINFKAR
ncbi:MAG: hypothetical protein HOP30_09955 [Cyclobacteriaceae bacterium]|nr:hypothetical protein [Cyclobacteriaceae bacterium]